MPQRAIFSGPTNRAIRAALTARLPDLEHDPNIAIVSVGEKIAGGSGTGLKAVKFYVHNKGKLGQSFHVPRHLDLTVGSNRLRVPTDVVEIVAEPELFGMQAGDTLVGFDGDEGTSGLTFRKNGRDYAFTNAHVVRRLQSGGTVGPVDWDDPVSGIRQHGALPVFASDISFSAINTEDAAVLALDPIASGDPNRVRVANVVLSDKDFIRPISGEYWFVALGRINTCAGPEPVDIPARVRVDGGVARFSKFWKLRLVNGVSQAGISGALLCRTQRTPQGERHIACGLIFGGVPGQFVWAYSFAPLFDRVFNALP